MVDLELDTLDVKTEIVDSSRGDGGEEAVERHTLHGEAQHHAVMQHCSWSPA